MIVASDTYIPITMVSQIVEAPLTGSDLERGHEQKHTTSDQILASDEKKEDPAPVYEDAFGNEEFAEVKYKTLKWW